MESITELFCLVDDFCQVIEPGWKKTLLPKPDKKIKSRWDGFFGFKLHLAINPLGEFLEITVTPGNVDDRKPLMQWDGLFGKLFADKGRGILARRSPCF